jgi:hypothetical protein
MKTKLCNQRLNKALTALCAAGMLQGLTDPSCAGRGSQ